MITIKARKYGDSGQVKLSLRVKSSGYDNNVSLGVSIAEDYWTMVSRNLKALADAHKSGMVVSISDTMTMKLWDLLREMQLLEDAGKLLMDSRFISDSVRKIWHREELKEVEAAEAVEVQTKAKPTFMEFVGQYIDECESGKRLKQKSSRKISASTLKSYKGFKARMQEYQDGRKCVVDWDDLTLDFYNDFKQFFLAKGYCPNTIGRYVKDMKTMLYAAKDMHLTTRDDFMSRQWVVDREDVDNVYITEERLRELHDLDLDDSEKMLACAKAYAKDDVEASTIIGDIKRDRYRQSLREARDIFLMGCLVGQRVSDYKRINTDMIETIQGEREFLHLIQVKTEKDVYIPYNNMICEILQRYDGKLPKMCDQHLNRYIKVVGLLLGWTEPAGLTERKGLMEYPSKKRFCDAMVTHTARRTFATNAYKNGVSLSAIMAVTGHSSEEMLRRYLKLGTKERALLAAAEFDKLKTAF